MKIICSAWGRLFLRPLLQLGCVLLLITGAAGKAADAPANAPASHERPIEEVRVFAHPLGERANDLAQPLLVIEGAELKRKSAISLGDTVGSEPGVHNSSFGQAVGRPVIRGLDGPRVRTLEDNLDSLDVATTSNDHAVTIEPFLAEQIEILKGPSSLLYGSGAIGGVVNVVSHRVPLGEVEDGVSGGGEFRLGDVDDERAGVAHLDASVGNLNLHIDAFRRKTDDYEIPGFAESDVLRAAEDPDEVHEEEEGHEQEAEISGKLPNTDIETEGGAVGAAYEGERAFVGFAVSRFESEYGLPPGGHEHEEEGEEGEEEIILFSHEEGHEDEAEEVVRIDMEQTRYDLRAGLVEPLTSIERAELRLAVNRYEHNELEGPELGTQFENDAVDSRLLISHEELGGWQGTVGLHYTQRDFSATGEEAFVPPNESDNFAFFIAEGRRFGDVDAQIGARIERATLDTDDLEKDFTLYSLSTGLSLPVSDRWRVAVQGDYSSRAPTPEELFSNGPHLALQTFEIGDPDLNKETALSLSATLSAATDPLEFSVSAYVSDFRDFVFLDDLGFEEDGLPARQHRQEDAQIIGLDSELVWHTYHGSELTLDVRGFFDVVRGQLDSDVGDKDLPRIPPRRFGAGLSLAWRGILGDLALTQVDEQRRVAQAELASDDYLLLSANLAYRIEMGAAELELFVRGNNLLDQNVRLHTSFIKDTAPAPGRSVIGGVRLSF